MSKLSLQHSFKQCETSGQGDPLSPTKDSQHWVSPSCGVCHTEGGTLCRCGSLSHISWEMLPFLFLGSVSLTAASPSVQWATWHPLLSLGNARTLDKCLYKGFWDLWFMCPLQGLKPLVAVRAGYGSGGAPEGHGGPYHPP